MVTESLRERLARTGRYVEVLAPRAVPVVFARRPGALHWEVYDRTGALVCRDLPATLPVVELPALWQWRERACQVAEARGYERGLAAAHGCRREAMSRPA